MATVALPFLKETRVTPWEARSPPEHCDLLSLRVDARRHSEVSYALRVRAGWNRRPSTWQSTLPCLVRSKFERTKVVLTGVAMSRQTSEYRTLMPVAAGELFEWHERIGAFDRLTPPWAHVYVLDRTDGIHDGARVTLHIKEHGLNLKWVLEHRDYQKGRQFADTQVEGPFAFWEQQHHMEPQGEQSSYLNDRLEYQLPASVPDALGIIRHELKRLFQYRHTTLQRDLRRISEQGLGSGNVLMSGSTGLIGSALLPFLSTQGYTVTRLVRPQTRLEDFQRRETGTIEWDMSLRESLIRSLDGESFDAVVHLAGDSIGERWSSDKKKRIRESRGTITRRLSEALAGMKNPPSTLLCASAIGFYGDRGNDELTEQSTPGRGFLADVCKEWESATQPARDAGIRVVNLRFGVVLSPRGGAMAKMLPPFLIGAGGNLGSGKQYFSWVSIDDAISAVEFAIRNHALAGPVNIAVPKPITNAEFTRALGRAIGRPTVFPIPAFGVRALMGEMADECLLVSQRVLPSALLDNRFKFDDIEIEPALRRLLGREQ